MFIGKLDLIQEEIKKIKKSSNLSSREVEIMIVTKNQNSKAIKSLVKKGYSYFGENRVDELIEKKRIFPNSRFAFIAPIQSRKFKSIMDCSDEVHSISRMKEIQLMADYSWPGDYYLQINIDKNENKSGIEIEDTFDFFDYANRKYKLPKGLMCMRSLEKTISPEDSFQLMKEINNKVIEKYEEYDGGLSMGMSNDYKEAIIYGATVVRIGSGIFGK